MKKERKEERKCSCFLVFFGLIHKLYFIGVSRLSRLSSFKIVTDSLMVKCDLFDFLNPIIVF